MFISALPPWIIHSIILIGLIIGSITDLKKREVPDLLNYFLISIGIVFGLVISILLWTPWPILSSIGGLAGGYLFGALMFYTGQWGGGDAKMLMGIGAIMGLPIFGPFSITQGNLPIFATTIISILLAGAVYGIGYMIYLSITKYKDILHYLEKPKQKKLFFKQKITLGISVILLIGISFIPQLQIMQTTILLLAGLVFIGGIAIIASKIIETVCMVKTISVNNLTEGDWIVKEIRHNGKRICGPKDLGITTKQIQKLKKYKIKKIVIKEGIPFIPGFFLGYLLIIIFGNWIPPLIHLII